MLNMSISTNKSMYTYTDTTLYMYLSKQFHNRKVKHAMQRQDAGTIDTIIIFNIKLRKLAITNL